MTELATVMVETQGDVQVARVAGEVDISNATQLQSDISGIVRNDAAGLVLDLSNIHYLDSAGIRMLFELRKRLTGRRQSLRVVVPRESVIITALLVTEVEQVIPIDETVYESVGAIANGGRPAG
jgi:anti-anti-sigma factor